MLYFGFPMDPLLMQSRLNNLIRAWKCDPTFVPETLDWPETHGRVAEASDLASDYEITVKCPAMLHMLNQRLRARGVANKERLRIMREYRAQARRARREDKDH